MNLFITHITINKIKRIKAINNKLIQIPILLITLIRYSSTFAVYFNNINKMYLYMHMYVCTSNACHKSQINNIHAN